MYPGCISHGGEKKNKKNTKKFVVPPALKGNDILAYNFEFFHHQWTGHDLDKGAGVSRANERRQTGHRRGCKGAETVVAGWAKAIIRAPTAVGMPWAMIQ